MNTALGRPLPASPRSASLSEEAIYFSSLGWKERSGGGRVPAESPTGDAAPGATVSHFCCRFLPHSPIHFPSPAFLIFTRELRRHRLPRRSGAWGGGPHSGCHLCLPRSQTRFIRSSAEARTAHNASSLAGGWPAPPPRLSPCLVVSPRGKHAVLSQPSSLTPFPSHSGVIKKRATHPPPPPSLLSIPSGVFFSSPHLAASREPAV